MQRKPKSAGFTLVELLVALLVFAVLSAMAYGGLNSVLRTGELTEVHAKRLATLQLVYRTLERDLEQIVDRKIRNEYGELAAPVIGTGSLENLIEFTRGGWRNPTGQLRSSMERVSYGIEDRALVRRRWPGLDRSQNVVVVKSELLPDIDRLAVRFLNSDQVWQDNWLFETIDDAKLPLAIEVILETKQWGSLSWIFRVAA